MCVDTETTWGVIPKELSTLWLETGPLISLRQLTQAGLTAQKAQEGIHQYWNHKHLRLSDFLMRALVTNLGPSWFQDKQFTN